MARQEWARWSLAAALVAGWAGSSGAQTLRIGLAAETTALDPLSNEITSNYTATRHIFDTLVQTDAQQRPGPGLALRWSARGERQWVFDLRPDVRFSDGTPFTGRDVLFTFCRILNNPTAAPGAFAEPVRNMENVELEGEHRVVVTTRGPNPLLPADLSNTAILSSRVAGDRPMRFTPEDGCGVAGSFPAINDFNGGQAAIGTGPFTLEDYVPGQRLMLRRNESYWGPKPHWARVELRPVTAGGPRVAGLLAGDFDLIENPAARDLERIRRDGRFTEQVTPSTRIMYLQPDVARARSPMVNEGGRNPLQDLRVRQAISAAIDRKAIVERVMEGAAEVAYQFLPDGMSGALDPAPELRFDPALSRRLLAEAGYPDGFPLVLHASNNRYVNDAKVAQTLAQYLSRVGIRATVDTMPVSVFFTRRRENEFSLTLGGWGSSTGEASSFLRHWVATANREEGLGSRNYGGYSNPELDAVLKQALRTMDDAAREALLRQAVSLTLRDLPEIPLYFESSTWAFRKDLAFTGRVDQMTLATEVRPAP
ncbi:ABC transporter substrate-binding protein [Teichococcus vastitatis]|uniref:ABC transporter substrate-binding protein n=1 Tax=Teichococcus vastitatis TaxID=2307076 RepID=A0ABS9W7L0_9PROT|nr:ABC transporter substrate-binding protein [Pseudoroseomonas vastitatis]MCI0755286.1 ABC transporter substrate-binding protein [Pseudoroseomonas vastitatis]